MQSEMSWADKVQDSQNFISVIIKPHLHAPTSFIWQVPLWQFLFAGVEIMTKFPLTSVLVEKLACQLLNKYTCQRKFAK
jgi:hypothetical protein